MNIALLCLSISAILCCIYAALLPRRTLPLFFVWVGIADLGKRLLWIPANAQPSFLEYSIALLLPDLVLMAGAGRLLFDCIIRKRVPYAFHWLDLPVLLFFVWSLINVLNPGKSVYVGLTGFKSFQLYVLVYVSVRLYPGSLSRFISDLQYPILGISLVAAFYGMYQAEYGFTNFEVRWLSSGISRLGSFGSEQTNQVGQYGATIAMHNIVRVFSTFASHEQFGFFLGFAAVLLYLFSGRSSVRHAALAIICLMLMRTLSRSSWIFALSAAGIIVAANFLSRKNARSVYAVVLVGWMAAGYFFWNYYTAKMSMSPAPKIVQNQNNLKAIRSTSPGRRDSLLPQSTPGTPLKKVIPRRMPAPKKQAPATITPPDAYASRVFTVGTYEWRIFTFQSLIADPSWRRFFGNGTGSMWYAWRVGAPGTTLPTPQEIRTSGLPVPGKRVLSHVGTVDIIYEGGILGFFLFLWILIAAVYHSIRLLRKSGPETDPGVVTAGLAVLLGIVVANSMVATILIFRPISAPFWLSLGLIAFATSRAAQRKVVRPSSPG